MPTLTLHPPIYAYSFFSECTHHCTISRFQNAGASEMAQQVKVLATKPQDLIYVVKTEPTPESCPPTSTHSFHGKYVCLSAGLGTHIPK